MEIFGEDKAARNDPSLSDIPSPVEKLDNLKSLDKDGDAILSIEDLSTHNTIQFLVSTKVLSLASPVFAKMFGPDFEEGHQLRREGLVHVRLGDDDATAMEIILKAVHYNYTKQLDAIDAEGLASLAIHCDKYNCRDALYPWISYWFNSFEQRTLSSQDLGFLVLAAYKFGERKHFADISTRALRELPLHFSTTWQSYEMFNLLPKIVTDVIAIQIQRLLTLIQINIQRLEVVLRRNKTGYEMPCQICVNCRRTPPLEAGKCRPCNNSSLYQKYCTGESRIAELFAILEKEELWPSVKPFEIRSLSDIVFRLTCAKNDLRHSCAAGGRCPLNSELDGLCRGAQQIKVDCTSLCLSCIRKGERNETQRCNCIK